MPKNIVLFSDGTGNSSAKLFKTNVWRLYDALDLKSPDQVAYYDDGVGTSAFKPYAVLGGALGLGLKRNVKHIYAFLCRNYEPGDRIFGFGFSRGAFTMRIVVGLVHSQGLVRADNERDLWRGIDKRWTAYSNKSHTRIATQIRKLLGKPLPQVPPDGQIKFTFLGLWDTVSAYGLPMDELTRAWDQYVWPLSMRDRNPSSSILKAFHALSLDDERNTFHPVLWNEARGDAAVNSDSTHLDQERISQVWFPGVHSNVGGGYPDDALSQVSLAWIMGEAAKHLRFLPGELERVKAEATPTGKLYDPRQGLGGYYRYNPRKIARLTDDDFNDVYIWRPKIHESVLERIRNGSDRYAPIGLPVRYGVVRRDNSIADAEKDTAAAIEGSLESESQAKARASLQERVWDFVWQRRIVYFSTLLVSAWLVLFPLIYRGGLAGACLSDYFCSLAKPIGMVGAVLPDFLDPWIESYQSNPGWFLLVVGILSAMLYWSAHLGTRIKDDMRAIWKPILAAPVTEVPAAEAPRGVIYALRTHRVYRATFLWFTRYALPGLFAIAIYWALTVLVSKVSFNVLSAAGVGCTPSASPRPVVAAMSFKFDPAQACAPSGLLLQTGARYRVWIEVDERSPWADADIETDLVGFPSRDRWVMYAGAPFRRWWTQFWFKPIARVGATGTDEYPLDPRTPFADKDDKKHLYTEIRARRDGELFLFVNDAVLLWPTLHAYRNNQGTAQVIVQRVDSRPPPQPQLLPGD